MDDLLLLRTPSSSALLFFQPTIGQTHQEKSVGQLDSFRTAVYMRNTHLIELPSPLYTLANLALITGAKRRSVQLWADAKVINASKSTEKAGSGVHRNFPRQEVLIACMIAVFAKEGMQIGKLLELSVNLRDLFSEHIERERIEAAVNTNNIFYLVLSNSYAEVLTAADIAKALRRIASETHRSNSSLTVVNLNRCFSRLRDFEG